MKHLLTLLIVIGCLGLFVAGCQSEAKTVQSQQPAEKTVEPETVEPQKAVEVEEVPEVIAPKIPSYFGEPDDYDPLTEEGCGQAD